MAAFCIFQQAADGCLSQRGAALFVRRSALSLISHIVSYSKSKFQFFKKKMPQITLDRPVFDTLAFVQARPTRKFFCNGWCSAESQVYSTSLTARLNISLRWYFFLLMTITITISGLHWSNHWGLVCPFLHWRVRGMQVWGKYKLIKSYVGQFFITSFFCQENGGRFW